MLGDKLAAIYNLSIKFSCSESKIFMLLPGLDFGLLHEYFLFAFALP